MAGKGDTFRRVDGPAYRENFDRAFTNVPGLRHPTAAGRVIDLMEILKRALQPRGLTGVDPRPTLPAPDPSGV